MRSSSAPRELSRAQRAAPALSSLSRWPSTGAHPTLALIRPPRSARAVARLILLLLPSLALILLLLPWRQTARGMGEVIAYDPALRPQSIEAPVYGRLTTWHVREGQRVEAGDPIAEIVDNDQDYAQRLEEKRAAAQEAERSAEAQVRSYTDKLAAEQASLAVALGEYDAKLAELARKRVGELAELEAAEQNAERIEVLSTEGITSIRTNEVAIASVGKARAAVAAREAEIEAVRAAREKVAQQTLSKIAAVEAELEAARAKVAEASQKRLDAEVSVARQQTRALTAPLSGVVQDLQGGPGGQLKEGDALVTLVPDVEQPAVEIYVDGNDMPLVRPGDEARIIFEGWPALQVNAWPYVSAGTFAGRVAFVSAAGEKGRFRILILPDPDQPTWPPPEILRQGVKAKAWVLLSEVSIGYELWRQINGFPQLPAVVEGDKPTLPTNKKPRAPADLK